MSEKLIFDNGIREYEVNGRELLRFNPTDPNVYNRFFEVAEELAALEEDYTKEAKALETAEGGEGIAAGGRVLKLMCRFDSKVKARLSYVFGAENDFDKILDGVNLMAVGANGERIVTNVFAALQPILEDGVRQHGKDAAAKAVAQAKANRAQRRGAE